MAFGTLSFFDNFDRSSTNIQCATCISTDGAHFACCVTNGFQIKCVYTLKTRSDNFAKLLVRIWLEINSSETFETTTALKYVVESQWQCIYLTHPAGNLVGKYSFRQVHRVCNSNDNKPRIRTIGPFEKIVHNCLFFRDHQVQFIHQDNAVGSLVRISKFLFFCHRVYIRCPLICVFGAESAF